MNRDIDRPLGQTPGKTPPARMRRPGPRGVLTMAGAVVIATASVALVALRDNPFGSTPAVSVAQPQPPQQIPAAVPKIASGTPAKNSGPAIIKAREQPSSGGSIVIRDPSAVGQNTQVAHLPDRALIEHSELGPLPVRGADGRRPVDVYARPWSGTRGARVAIVIGGLSLSQTGTQEAIAALPSEVTLAFAPQGNSIDRWMQMARHEGHEIVMQVPLEPFDYPNVNPGRHTLTVGAPPERNLRNLRWALGRTTNYTGVMNYMGARFTADAEAMAPVMAELGERGLLYLDDGSSARSVAGELAQGSAVPFAASDAAIDAVRERGEILKKLDELERIAHAKGYAVGHGSAFDITVSAVSSWVEEAKKRGIEIVPVSALAFDPERG